MNRPRSASNENCGASDCATCEDAPYSSSSETTLAKAAD